MTKKVKKEVRIILTNTLNKSHKVGSLLVVKSGYARNYIIPKKLGKLATQKNIENLIKTKTQIQLKEKLYIETCVNNKNIIEKSGPFVIQKRIGEKNKIFGTITRKQVKEIIEKQTNLKIENALFEIPVIKELGDFPLSLELHPTVKANIEITIIAL